jgi:hypothetical protein
MEVHYHPKHSGKPRINKEYLFEFLVIFIAITGSFFAENLREHFIDKHKEKEYMESMLQDLKTDTTNINNIVLKNNEQIKGIDSLLGIMVNETYVSNKLFYHYDLTYTSSYNGFIPVMRTISQLMNTGGLGLVRVKPVSDGIVDYSVSVSGVVKQGELLDTRFIRSLEQKTEIIDLLSLKKLHPGSSPLKAKDYPPLLSTDKKKIHAYYFNISILRGTISAYSARLKTLNGEASSLIQLIQHQYKLE